MHPNVIIQGWVSKLIPENKISEEIAENTFELLKRTNLINLKEDPESLDKLLDGLKSYLVLAKIKIIFLSKNTIYEVISK